MRLRDSQQTRISALIGESIIKLYGSKLLSDFRIKLICVKASCDQFIFYACNLHAVLGRLLFIG